MENRVKILIADGNEEFCDHVKRRLEQVPGYEIVGTAADGQRAAELMRVTKPDILVLDLMLSKLDGIAVLKRAREMDKPPAALWARRSCFSFGKQCVLVTEVFSPEIARFTP